jgi:transmembrane 9 superfamily protein 1
LVKIKFDLKLKKKKKFCFLVGFPLTILGGIFGKNWSSNFDAPCRTKNIAREIPEVAWYRSNFVRMLIGGFLPFSAISVELYYIFSTFWGREQYMLYGILTIVFLILLSVTACISIALTYFQLASEDYRWWWQSIISSG